MWRENPFWLRGLIGVFLDCVFQIKYRLDERIIRGESVKGEIEEVMGNEYEDVFNCEFDKNCEEIKILRDRLWDDCYEWIERRRGSWDKENIRQIYKMSKETVEWKWRENPLNLKVWELVEYLLEHEEGDRRLNWYVRGWCKNVFDRQITLIDGWYKKDVYKRVLEGEKLYTQSRSEYEIDEGGEVKEVKKFKEVSKEHCIRYINTFNRLDKDLIIFSL